MSTNYGDGTETASGRGGSAHARGLRASDADREATATLLRQQYTEGRLNAQEYDERINRCYAAKTVRELDDLFIDLPRTKAEDTERDRARHDFHPPWRYVGVAPVVIAVVVVYALTGAHHLFWLLWPLLFFVFGPFGHWRRAVYRRWRGDGTTSV